MERFLRSTLNSLSTTEAQSLLMPNTLCCCLITGFAGRFNLTLARWCCRCQHLSHDGLWRRCQSVWKCFHQQRITNSVCKCLWGWRGGGVGMVPPITHPLLKKISTKSRSPLLLMAPQPYLPIAPSLPVLTSVKLCNLTVSKANEVSNPRIENLLAYISVRFYHWNFIKWWSLTFRVCW